MQTLSAADRRATLRASLDASELRRALDRVKPAVASRSAESDCRAVRIHTDNDGLIVCAANAASTIRTRVHAEVSGHGTTLVPFAPLRAVVGPVRGVVKLAEAVSSDGNVHLAVQAGSAMARLGTLAVASFPALTFDGAGHATPLDLGAIRRVLPAVSRDKHRPLLQAVLLNRADIVATDSYRLHLERVADPLPRCLLPSSVLAVLAATHRRAVDFRLDEVAGLAQLTVPDTEYLVRTLPGEWVDYERLLPRPAEITVVGTASTKDLVDAAAQLRPLTTSCSPAPPAWLTFKTDRITMRVDVPEVVGGKIEIPAEVDGAAHAVCVAFNLAYLIDCVRACEAERVSIQLRDARRAAVIIGEGVHWDRTRTGLRLLMPTLLPPPPDVSSPRGTSQTGAAGEDGRNDDGVGNADHPLARRISRLGRRRAAR